MTPADIDRSVNSEAPIEPSPRFSPRVMRAVRAEMADRRARRLAWRQLRNAAKAFRETGWPAAAVASVLVPVVVAARVLGVSELSPAHADATLWLAITIAGTLALASWCTRLVARH